MTDKISLFKKYNINGPVNIIRLYNNEKILYILGDSHPYNNECSFDEDIESIDIDKFLFKFIKKNKTKEIDFFVEQFMLNKFSRKYFNDKSRYIYAYYIHNVIKLFENLTREKNKKRFINMKFSNYRFHYSNIRNDIFLYNTFDLIFNNILNDFNNYNFFLYSYKIQLKDFYKLIKLFRKKFNKNIILKYFVKFNDDKIKNNVIKIINDIIIANLNNSIKSLKKLIKITKKYEDMLINSLEADLKEKILKKYNNIIQNIRLVFLCITDLYFIKRFTDKSYIKTAVLYTGFTHFNNIIFILLKYFNFKISHIYKFNPIILHNKPYSFEDITKLDIKNFLYIDILDKLFNQNSDQCSNFYNFPENFD